MRCTITQQVTLSVTRFIHALNNGRKPALPCSIQNLPLNTGRGNGNYFFFIHPISTHGVLFEFVSYIERDEEVRARYVWSGTETYIVPPDIN